MAIVIVPQGKPLANYGDQAPTIGPMLLRVPSNFPVGTVVASIQGYTGQQVPQFHPKNQGIDVIPDGLGGWSLVRGNNLPTTLFGVLSAPGSNSAEVVVWVAPAYIPPGSLSGFVPGSGSLLGYLNNIGNNGMSGVVSGYGSVAAALSNTPPATVTMSGSIQGVGVIFGTLMNQVKNLISGNVQGAGSLTGMLSNTTEGSVALSGGVFGSGIITGSLTNQTKNLMSSSILGAGIFAGTLTNSSGSSRPWTPADLAVPPIGWLDPMTGSTLTYDATSKKVSSMTSRSGSAASSVAVTQATAASQPVYNPTGINGFPSITWASGNQMVGSDSMFPTGLASEHFAGVLLDAATDTSFRAVWSHGTPSTAQSVVLATENTSSRQLVAAHYGGDVTGPNIGNTAHVVSVKQVAASGGLTNTFTVDGTDTIASNTQAQNTQPNQFLLGQWVFNNPWNGQMGELVWLGYAPTDADRYRLDGYLAWRWGLQNNLAASNPYSPAAGATSGPIVTM